MARGPRRRLRAGWLNRGMRRPESGCPPRVRVVLRANEEVKGMEVLIGVDPHKAVHSVAAVGERGDLLEQASFDAGRSGLRSLVCWAKRFPERRWAVEGANGMGHLLARHLVARGEKVVDVPAKLSARVRVLSVGHESARTTGLTPSTSPLPLGTASGYGRWTKRSTPPR